MMRKVDRARSDIEQSTTHRSDQDSLNILQQHTASHRQLQQSDSSDASYVLEIWPKGTFSISNGAGFVGEAEKVKVRGRHLNVQKTLLAVDSVHTAMKLIQQRSAVEELNNSRTRVLQLKKQPAWEWALMLLAAAVAADLIYTLYQKKKATHR